MSDTSDEIVWPGCPPGTRPIYNAERLWGYDIKMGGPATALALFYLLGLILILQLALARNPNTYYMITLVVSALAEGGAYSAAVHTVRKSCKESLFDSFIAAQVSWRPQGNAFASNQNAWHALQETYGNAGLPCKASQSCVVSDLGWSFKKVLSRKG